MTGRSPQARRSPTVYEVASMYRDEDRLVIRRAAYHEIALHTEGPGRDVYLSRAGAVRLAVALLRQAAKRVGPADDARSQT